MAIPSITPPPGLADRLRLTLYEACPDFHTSDHKPIRSAFEITPAPDLYTYVRACVCGSGLD